VIQTVSPAVQRELGSLLPGILNDRCFGKIINAFHNVQLHQAVGLLIKIRDTFELAGMKTIHVFDMTQPIIDQPELLIRQGGSHTATTVMTTDDNVSHLKYIYCIIEHTEQIHITVDNYIGNVA